MKISLLGGLWQNLIDSITGFLAYIPQLIYFIYTCCASLIDLFQYSIRKLVGLDVYYVNGKAVSGDIVIQFIRGILGIDKDVSYSSISTVFWSLLVFGVFVLVFSTIFAVIKAHYNYDAEKSHPLKIVMQSIKTLCLMAIIPIVSFFGITLANVLLQVLDTMTSPAGITQMDSTFRNSSVNYTLVFEKGETRYSENDSNNAKLETYSSYDFFGSQAYTNMPSISGLMFNVAARNCNRVRYGAYTASTSSTMNKGVGKFLWTDYGIFTSTTADPNIRQEEVATMIDYAFANCLTLKNPDNARMGLESSSLITTWINPLSAPWAAGLFNVKSFSKYNVGLVYYYYNLWSFNYFLAYAALVAFAMVFGSLFFGLVVRLITLLALFLVFPTLVGIGPIDGNAAIGKWKSEFIKNVLMGYGAIGGINLSFLLIQSLQNVYFFTSPILNYLMDMVLMLAAMSVVKDVVKIISTVAGGADPHEVGQAVKKELAKPATAAVDAGLKAASLALKAAGHNPVVKLIAKAGSKVIDSIRNSREAKKSLDERRKGLGDEREGIEEEQAQRDQEVSEGVRDAQENELMKQAEEAGLQAREKELDSEEEVEDFKNDLLDDIDLSDVDGSFNNMRGKMEQTNKKLNRSDDSLNLKILAEDLKSGYLNGAANIDADTKLTDAQKSKRKHDLYKELRKQAIQKYTKNNESAVAARGFRDEEKDVSTRLQSYRNEHSAALREEARFRRRRKHKLGYAMLDLGGSTLKMMGQITGIVDLAGGLRRDNPGVIDSAKEVIQDAKKTWIGEKLSGFIKKQAGTEDLPDALEDGTSSLLTEKQKKKLEVAGQERFLKEMQTNEQLSKRFNKQIEALAREIRNMYGI